MQENWRPIEGLDQYLISDLGNVKRSECVRTHKRYGSMRLPERMLNPGTTLDGYKRINFCGKHYFVHVLVMETFVFKRPEGMQVCHNNGVPDDNRLENLRWDYPKCNIADRHDHGTYQYGIKNPNAKYPDSVILAVYESKLPILERSKMYEMPVSTVYLINAGLYPRLKRMISSKEVVVS